MAAAAEIRLVLRSSFHTSLKSSWNVVTYTAPGFVVDDYPGRVTPESWVNS